MRRAGQDLESIADPLGSDLGVAMTCRARGEGSRTLRPSSRDRSGT
jgi:hypothetical protein